MPRRWKGLEQPLLPLTDSPLKNPTTHWLTSPSYQQSSLTFSSTAFHSVTDALLENPNLNSSHLFRADIVFDSTGILKTNKEKEDCCCGEYPGLDSDYGTDGANVHDEGKARAALPFDGFKLRRTVLRRLIPRNPQLDRPLLQTCHIYTEDEGSFAEPDMLFSSKEDREHESAHLLAEEKLKNKSLYRQSIARHSQHLVVYQPHVDPLTGSDIPKYHPPLQLLAFLYSHWPSSDPAGENRLKSDLSLHFKFFQKGPLDTGPSEVTNRLHRTLLSLLRTLIRMARNTPITLNPFDGEEEATPVSAAQYIKDNIVPEHLLQNTYSRLKTLYASDLIKRWVEKTDPSKHVFEDLSIAAFLIELWKKMYGSNPSDFPGFVDIACGNGVLVYILITEGFRGWGFDARVRRTWAIFPKVVTAHLREAACVPRPFFEALQSQAYRLPDDVLVHNGIFDGGTFIISNHADELTTWTPLLAALSCPESPLPWLAIPCCSHALSGAAHRYQPRTRQMSGAQVEGDVRRLHRGSSAELDRDEQPRTGDLTALRNHNAARWKPGQAGRTSSRYASLVNQVVDLAQKVDQMGDIQQTLMRIPSTRNIGVVGGQRRTVQRRRAGNDDLTQSTSGPRREDSVNGTELVKQIYDIVEQECGRPDGVTKAAKIWMERVQKARGTTCHTCRSD